MDTQSTPELLPCPNPWCVRGEVLCPTLRWFDMEAAVECASCGMQGPLFSPIVTDEDGEQVGTRDAEAEAVAAWNTRSTPDRNAVLFKRMVYFIECIAHADREGWNDATIDEARRLTTLMTTTPEPKP